MSKPLLTVLVFLSACFSISQVPYTVNPTRIADPKTEIKNIVLTNTVQGCLSEPEFSTNMLVVKFVCSRSVGNFVARFDRVESISLEQSGEWYRVRVQHKNKVSDDFYWSSKSLEDMQRLADALSALSTPSHEQPAKTGEQTL